ncbi:MAG: YggS family pyridoxal phosphate-dependent enzyme [Brachymonas denitrificans]|jgi:pyridoxal phosphate enzyme (YggS family)|uniref:YggS family pyridoxal phosphate-dependent enzyme n=1 Tax=Brachymonas denitrificans TaxID=28220 RepID=UPI001BD04563|nr:YggS family pyridoxal phosphate-dependent enzyme [Brachymonas denitrificans]
MPESESLSPIATSLAQVQQRIAAATQAAGRAPGSVRLLAVSKTFPAEAVREAAAAGQLAFGENYVQEAVAKIDALQALGLEWHCIGPLQSRKSGQVATHFDWLQSLDRLDIAQRLSRQRPPERAPLQVCLQVNMDGGATKSGLAPEQVGDFARAVRELPGLQLRGLMSIPEPYDDPQQMLQVHQRTRALFDEVGARLDLPQWDTLSMGMSGDLELAIAAGSTMVRVGTAIFGQRSYPAPV